MSDYNATTHTPASEEFSLTLANIVQSSSGHNQRVATEQTSHPKTLRSLHPVSPFLPHYSWQETSGPPAACRVDTISDLFIVRFTISQNTHVHMDVCLVCHFV